MQTKKFKVASKKYQELLDQKINIDRDLYI